ncbi:MAG TPA: hypothetical protein VNM37_11780 [Candidatus Dormibacteraeota bacterium]|nr:hypothetical protein [Candidatus Dormibacteraeota bacterium]
MSEENTAPAPADGEDTAAVLAQATGEKTFLPEKGAEPDPKPEEEKIEDPGEDATAAKPDEGEAGQPKPKQTAQERIAELTRLRREAERDRDFYKEQALRGGKPTDDPAPAAQTTEDNGKPNPENYAGGAHDPDYIEHLTDWKAQVAVNAALANRDASQTLSTKLSGFEGKVAELFPDGEPAGLKAFRALPSLPAAVSDVLLASDIGPKLAEHLGDNPGELARLSGLSPALQARELTQLETRLAPPAKPTPKTATDAPEPAPQARGASGQFKVAPDTDDFSAFERQYRIGGSSA